MRSGALKGFYSHLTWQVPDPRSLHKNIKSIPHFYVPKKKKSKKDIFGEYVTKIMLKSKNCKYKAGQFLNIFPEKILSKIGPVLPDFLQ